MTAPKRFKQSGPNLAGNSSQRHTVKLDVRCKPELAAEVRAYCAETKVTMSEMLAAGLAAMRKGDW
jgi:hypothetical protein